MTAPLSTAPLLAAQMIRFAYGSIEVLRGVDLAVATGETFAIIGPNGAGKTTLFKVLTGETLDHQGEVRLDGVTISHLPSHRRARLGMGRTFQVARVFGELSVRANVMMAVEARRASGGETRGAWWDWRPSAEVRAEAAAVLAQVALAPLAEAEAARLSHGDKKRLELALTLAIRPRVLMLDEPTAGMSIEDRRAIAGLLGELKRQGMTIVLTEHDMDVVFGLADRIMVLNRGEVVRIGAPAEIRADPAVKRIYLGQSDGDADA